ncbi:FHA domain-containing protein [Actinomadura rubrisoli]|uniref:FHA domain-containing protein n=1 Tax=Actinomadura rubrisoli TaxID=2530368 RepID=A0A4R5BW33_9ACTN|nr:FHA domain-containing protein [Actinomadura rubrisoli]TDD89936.1 FHA domain-containing protein [Actinomadura rubrisoli]
MPVCPSGHTSSADDYCDVCGHLMEGARRAEFSGAARPHESASASVPPSAPASASRGGAEAGPEVCPRCGTPKSGRFCEVDGHDFAIAAVRTAELSADRAAQGAAEARRVPVPRQGDAPRPDGPPGAPPGWSVLIRADLDYYNSVIALEGPDSAALAFPPYCPERRVPLTGDQMRIGRRSTSRAILPEIDLSTPPEDPGVSHLHAVLLAQPDGTWVLVDPGSTNGTTLNGATEPIPVNIPVPLSDGDRVHVGAWTTITLSLQEEGPP